MSNEAHCRRCVMERGHMRMALSSMNMGHGVLRMCIEAPEVVKHRHLKMAAARLERAMLLTERCAQVYSIAQDQFRPEPEEINVHTWVRLPNFRRVCRNNCVSG